MNIDTSPPSAIELPQLQMDGRASRRPSPPNDLLSMPKFAHGPTLGV
jgi:hypothetical protein